MKKILLLLAVIIGATACNFTEEIYFNKDGSGKLNIHFTGEELVDMMSEMDSTAKAQAIDTTFVFKEFFKEKKDSLAQLPKAEQERLKKLEPFTMRMVVDQKEGLLAFDMSSEFKAIAEIDDAFNAFQDAAAIGPSVGNATMEKPKEPSPTRVNYYYKNHRFKRTTTIVDQELFQQSLIV